jgi:hypothetical protein
VSTSLSILLPVVEWYSNGFTSAVPIIIERIILRPW